jgi:hypothetical protein
VKKQNLKHSITKVVPQLQQIHTRAIAKAIVPTTVAASQQFRTIAIIINHIINNKIQATCNKIACLHSRTILTEPKSLMEMDLVLWV